MAKKNLPKAKEKPPKKTTPNPPATRTPKSTSKITGRIVRLTSDSTIYAVNVPKNAKKAAILFEGENPYLSYVVGNDKKRLNLAHGNLKIGRGSKVLGFIDADNYDAEAIAGIYDVATADVRPASHLALLETFKKDFNIYFKNPFTKPATAEAQDGPEYQQWYNAEEGVWDKVLIMYKFDAEYENQRLRNAQERGSTEPTHVIDQPDSEVEQIAGPDENPLLDELEQAGQTLGEQLFDTGAIGYANGLGWGMEALRKKGLTHDNFRQHAISLFRYAYRMGQQSNTGLIEPVLRFLQSEKDLVDRSLTLRGLNLTPEHKKNMEQKSETLIGLIELLENLFGSQPNVD